MLFKAVDQLTGWILSRHRVLCASPLEIHMHTVSAKTHTKQKNGCNRSVMLQWQKVNLLLEVWRVASATSVNGRSILDFNMKFTSIIGYCTILYMKDKKSYSLIKTNSDRT